MSCSNEVVPERVRLASLQRLVGDPASALSIVLAARFKGDTREELRHLVTTEAVAHEFRKDAAAFLTYLSSDKVQSVRYDPAYRLIENEAMVLNVVDGDEAFASVVALISSLCDVDPLEKFAGEDSFIDALRFYTVVFQSGDGEEQALFLRVFPRTRELCRSGKLSLFFRNGVYDKLEDKVFVFDRQFDVVVWEGMAYIVRVGNFHRIFLYLRELEAQAGLGVDRILEILPIENPDEFRSAVLGQATMAAKAAAVLRRPYLEALSMTAIHRTIEKFDVPVRIAGSGPEARLVFETAPDRRWLILRLLDDDFLESAMTAEKYEVSSKRPHVP